MPPDKKDLVQDTPLSVGSWASHEDFPIHPIGSKPKRVLICPTTAKEPFLIPGHSYLFKTAEGWRSYQVWMEILAYRIALLSGLNVPPCFLAVDENRKQLGVLIEFFYGYPGQDDPIRLVHGVDLLAHPRSGRDRPHGVRTNVVLCQWLQISDAVDWWGRVLTFDALIGNTDRHTENWGLLATMRRGQLPIFKLAPPFDNGTSLGYEIREERLETATEPQWLAGYIDKGCHHCGWDRDDDVPSPHISLVERYLRAYPSAGAAMKSVIQFGREQITATLNDLAALDVDLPMSAGRVRFLDALVDARKTRLRSVLGE